MDKESELLATGSVSMWHDADSGVEGSVPTNTPGTGGKAWEKSPTQCCDLAGTQAQRPCNWETNFLILWVCVLVCFHLFVFQ